jgi:hypothetical protein
MHIHIKKKILLFLAIFFVIGSYNLYPEDSAIRDIPSEYVAGGSISVTIDINIDPADPPTGVIVTEYLPAGWSISGASPNYSKHSPSANYYSWLVYSDNGVTSFTITYTSEVPGNASGIYQFSGTLNTGQENPISGDTVISDQPITTYTLTVVQPEHGSISPTGGTYNEGTIVGLTATPETGYHFMQWQGDATGTGPNTTVTMDSNKTVTCLFANTCPFEIAEATPEWTNFSGTAKISGVDVEVGDCIGAFDPGGVCCGVYTVTAAGNYGYLPVYGDNPDTTTVDEGAVSGDTIIFKIWDADTGEICTADTLGPDAPIWAPQSDKTVNLNCTGVWRMPLKAGWNLFSFPVNRFYYDTDTPPAVATLPNVEYVKLNNIGDILTSIAGKYETIRSFDAGGAHTYVPDTPLYNNLHYLAPGYGYWIKMNQDAVLELHGEKVNPSDSLSLIIGWNLVGCWDNKCSYDSSSAPTVNFPEGMNTFSSVADVGSVLSFSQSSYDVIRSFDVGGAHTYAPDTPLYNNLHYLAPGYGYWLKMTVQESLHW